MPKSRGSERHLWPVLLLLALPAAAQDAIAPFACEQGVCGFNVPASRPVPEPCDEHTLLVAYRAGGGAVLVQCTARGAADDISLVFDSRSPQAPALELEGARFLKAGALREIAAQGVPDRFGPVPLCAGVPVTSAKGSIVLALKTPRPDAPPCYRTMQVVTGKDGVSVQADAALPATPAGTRWDAVRDLVRGLLPARQ
jgi:hypothetical protein